MKLEAQAIIFAAGPGSRMASLGTKAKALLPIGNYPMIYYPLIYFENFGFSEVTLIINQKEEKEFKKINENFDLKIKLDFAIVDTTNDPGTVDSLRQIESKIKKNIDEVILVSADLITDASLDDVLNFHRSRGLAVTLLTAENNAEIAKASPPGPKSKSNLSGSDVICFEEGTNRLAYAVSAGDYDDKVSLSSKIIRNLRGGLDLATDLLDAHLYIMKRWVVDYILSKDCLGMGSLKAEVIPHLIFEQFRSKHGVLNEKGGLSQHIQNRRYENIIREYNSSVVSSCYQPNSELDERGCFAFRHEGFCFRINTVGSFWWINRKIGDLYTILNINSPCNKQKENEKAQICDQSVVGVDVYFADKINVLNSVIGDFCKIEEKVRISNSLLFDHVEIAEGSVIENSLICSSIDKKCFIKNCIVANSSKIQEGGKYENEILESGLSSDYSY